MPQTGQLDLQDSPELILEIMSFAGGENTIGQDQELKSNEARVIENWDSDSLGGMIRAKGFSKIADSSGVYTAAPDLLLHHFEGLSFRNYAVIAGDLVRINGALLTLTDTAAFTPGTLCHGVSAGNKAWITNPLDSLKYTTIAGAITVPNSIPSKPYARIYYHKSRLVAEGNGTTVESSRGGVGNWTQSDAWTKSGDAWSIDLPDLTQGMGMNFPSGDEQTVFTKFGTYVLSNFPNVAFRPISSSHGCAAPYSIALGSEGLYFLSSYPILGLYLWNGTNFVNLTVNEDWITQVNLSNRIFGIYRENKYWIFYNEIGSGVNYTNRTRIYDARWGKWSSRVCNMAFTDSFGYPAVLTKHNNELYVTSSQADVVYQLEDTSDSDNGLTTNANYKTKDFTSLDFGLPMDEIALKLIKAVITYYGSTDQISMEWTADRGLHSGQMVFNVQAKGDLLNTTFVLNTSYLVSSPPDKTTIRKFSNAAIGRRFDFQFINSAMGDRTKIKKIKIVATVIGDTQDVIFDTPSSGISISNRVLVHPDDTAVQNPDGSIVGV